MKLARLFFYPVKSLAGIELQAALVDDFGIAQDRRWLVVDHQGNALTQRDYARLALIRPSLHKGGLQLDAPGSSPLVIAEPEGPQRQVRVWNDTMSAQDAGHASGDWLSAFLKAPACLVYMPDQTVRLIDPNYNPAQRRVSFADAFPFLLISQESMDELNRRLEEPIGIERFRPNLVVSGAAEAHAEDSWRSIRIGELQLDLVKPCDRCAVPTVDPVTAQKGKEPTRTLATYRARDGKVYFGQNAIHGGPGTLRVGAAVTLLEAVQTAVG